MTPAFMQQTKQGQDTPSRYPGIGWQTSVMIVVMTAVFHATDKAIGGLQRTRDGARPLVMAGSAVPPGQDLLELGGHPWGGHQDPGAVGTHLDQWICS